MEKKKASTSPPKRSRGVNDDGSERTSGSRSKKMPRTSGSSVGLISDQGAETLDAAAVTAASSSAIVQPPRVAIAAIEEGKEEKTVRSNAPADAASAAGVSHVPAKRAGGGATAGNGSIRPQPTDEEIAGWAVHMCSFHQAIVKARCYRINTGYENLYAASSNLRDELSDVTDQWSPFRDSNVEWSTDMDDATQLTQWVVNNYPSIAHIADQFLNEFKRTHHELTDDARNGAAGHVAGGRGGRGGRGRGGGRGGGGGGGGRGRGGRHGNYDGQQCPYCNKTYKTDNGLEKHVRTVHNY